MDEIERAYAGDLFNEDGDKPFFSIVTPTYNRASLLPRLYQSLRQQDFDSFEWVVIDDGSTDSTQDLIRALGHEAPFPVVYRKQVNGGKHRALNHALDVARGYFFVDIDSDDYFLPDTLGRYSDLWASLSEEQKNRLGGMVADCVHVDGRVVGRPFPRDRVVTNSIDLRSNLKVRGDKLYIYKTSVVREFPSPVFDGENFMQESVRHRRVARKYDLLGTTFAARVKDYQQGGLSAPDPGRLPNNLRNPQGARLRALEATNFKAKENGRELFKECVNYVRLSLHCGESFSVQFRSVKNRSMWCFAAPLGFFRFRNDLKRHHEIRGRVGGQRGRDEVS